MFGCIRVEDIHLAATDICWELVGLRSGMCQSNSHESKDSDAGDENHFGVFFFFKKVDVLFECFKVIGAEDDGDCW